MCYVSFFNFCSLLFSWRQKNRKKKKMKTKTVLLFRKELRILKIFERIPYSISMTLKNDLTNNGKQANQKQMRKLFNHCLLVTHFKMIIIILVNSSMNVSYLIHIVTSNRLERDGSREIGFTASWRQTLFSIHPN